MSFTVHLVTRTYCSALGREFTATRTMELPFAPFPGLVISFGHAPIFRVKTVVYNDGDGSCTLFEARTNGLAATETALNEWTATWRAVGFQLPDPSAPKPPYLRVVPT